MPRNVEIKAKVHNLEDLLEKAKSLSRSEALLLDQEDVFYQIPHGRLKLRSEKGKDSELIYYDRPDIEGPKLCDYNYCPVVANHVPGLKEVLARALGEKGVVMKKRHLLMVGQTRVHIDCVEDLGNFMELEVHEWTENGCSARFRSSVFEAMKISLECHLKNVDDNPDLETYCVSNEAIIGGKPFELGM